MQIKENQLMDKYEPLDIEVIVFEQEDILTESGGDWGPPYDN